MRKPTRSVADIFSGEVDSFTAVGGEDSPDLRLSEYQFKSGARNRTEAVYVTAKLGVRLV